MTVKGAAPIPSRWSSSDPTRRTTGSASVPHSTRSLVPAGRLPCTSAASSSNAATIPMPFSYCSGASAGGGQLVAQQIELVGGVHKAHAAALHEARLPASDGLQHGAASSRVTRRSSPSAASDTGTMPTSATEGSPAQRATVSSSTAPSFQPGHRTTCRCSSSPAAASRSRTSRERRAERPMRRIRASSSQACSET